MNNFKSKILLLMISIFLMIMTSCSPNQPQSQEPHPDKSDPTQVTNPDQSPEEGEPLPPEAAIRAREELAKYLDIEISEVEIISQEQADWSDSCLGLGGPAESCLAAITPGWRVDLLAEGVSYIARTDKLGDRVRFENLVVDLPVEPPFAQPPEDGSVPEAVLKARQMLANTLDLSVEKVEIVSYDHTDWPNGCLGLPTKDMMCTEAIVPGWRVELSADGQSFIARTDETGTQIKFE